MGSIAGSRSVPTTSKFVVALFVLGGLLLISLSFALPDGYRLVKEILKELGIVLLAVFVISWLYEVAIAEKYFVDFSTRLREIIETGESLTAASQQLGITGIYPRRDQFEREHPLGEIVDHLGDGGIFRVSARSVFHIANKLEILKAALRRSFQIQLCICDPQVSNQDVLELTDTQSADILAALGAFKADLIPWLTANTPAGSIEVKFHSHLLFDTFVIAQSGSVGCVVLDLSFGRDLTKKRVLFIDAFKPIGLDLTTRHERLWLRSKPVFEYSKMRIARNEL